MKMKLAFSTEDIKTESFGELCGVASDYGFDCVEIFDASGERRLHGDSVLKSASNEEGRRKLVNRRLEICALTYPDAVSGDTDSDRLCRYVHLALRASVPYVIVKKADGATPVEIRAAMEPAIREAEKYGVTFLFETVGDLASTERFVDIVNCFASVAVGAAWNIKETYFTGGESPDDTIRILGAYINYVRIGDKKDGEDVLIGEGELPVDGFFSALRSLNYEGSVAVDGASGAGRDVLLTHFKNYMTPFLGTEGGAHLFENRYGTGTYPWKKYEVLNMTFSEVLDKMVECYPDQPAFRYTTLDYTRSYSQFRDDVDRVAASLIALGVKPGYHVAVWATNVPEWFLTFWATVKIGAVLVTVNTAYKASEIEYLLRQSDTHTLVMIENCRDSNYKEIMKELCPELESLTPGQPLWSVRLPFLRNIVTVGFSMKGCLSWEEMLKLSSRVPKREVLRRASAVRPDDVCNMQYTSGTTGFPKGVMLTHNNIVNDGKIIGDRMDLSTADRMMIQVPMFHCFGMVLSMTSMMTHGGTVSPLPYFSARSSLSCISSERITCFNGVPTMFIAMFNHPDFPKTDFSHVRTGIMAGANCPADLMRRAADEMNMSEILSVYGLTEAAPGCTMGEVNEDIDLRVETVGSAFPGVECRIVDPETGEEVPDGESGEFIARGFNIMKGYYKMPAATAAAIDREGFLHSGDICCRTADGHFKVTGRLKDMIIRGGENLYPREIEEFYLTHPKVKDVQVVGVPDKVYGEECCAWIILKDGISADVEEFRAYGNERMARHKVPKYFILTDSFPMNAAGKILKYKMKEDSKRELGL